MSVIQDALKRRLRDQREARPSLPPEDVTPAPSVPPPTPPVAQQVLEYDMRSAPRPSAIRPPSNPAAPRSSTDWGKWLLGFVMGLLTLALFVATVYFMQRQIPLRQVAAPAPSRAVAPDDPAPSAQTANGAAAPSIRTSAAAAPGEWPLLVLDGVMMGPTPRKSSAILNGSMVFLNQRIDNVLLKQVKDEGIVLEFEGEERSLQIGESTR